MYFTFTCLLFLWPQVGHLHHVVIILIKFVQELIHLKGGEENGNEHVVRNDNADDQVDVDGASVGPRVSPSFLV